MPSGVLGTSALATLQRACTLLETERSRGRPHVPATKLRAAFGGTTGGENRYGAGGEEATYAHAGQRARTPSLAQRRRFWWG